MKLPKLSAEQRARFHATVLAMPDSPHADLIGPPTVCEMPPIGWRCTRMPGHDGPCAAWPVDQPEGEALSDGDKFRAHLAQSAEAVKDFPAWKMLARVKPPRRGVTPLSDRMPIPDDAVCFASGDPDVRLAAGYGEALSKPDSVDTPEAASEFSSILEFYRDDVVHGLFGPAVRALIANFNAKLAEVRGEGIPEAGKRLLSATKQRAETAESSLLCQTLRYDYEKQRADTATARIAVLEEEARQGKATQAGQAPVYFARIKGGMSWMEVTTPDVEAPIGFEMEIRTYYAVPPAPAPNYGRVDHYAPWQPNSPIGSSEFQDAPSPEPVKQDTPIDMVLYCPACGLQHIDAEEDGWDNPPHRSHLCHGCKHVWRPADVPTNGVAAVATTGSKDSPIATPVKQDKQAVDEELQAFEADFEETGDEKEDACEFLLRAAHKFWYACRNTGERGAVKWLKSPGGSLLIFTRSEYKDALMQNIESLPLAAAPASAELTHLRARVSVLEAELSAAKLTALGEVGAPVEVMEPVFGDVLPPVGSRVLIRHGRDEDDHLCTVTGYYALADLAGNESLHRVFVRLVYYGTTIEQARMLCDVRPYV